MPELMNTREVAQYLRLKERKIYDLVQRGVIPCTRVGGKWLFAKDRIDHWLGAQHHEVAPLVPVPAAPASAAPPVIAGSHDPFLEWCIAESDCGLAVSGGGSMIGLECLAAGGAVGCSFHAIDAATGTDNVPAIKQRLGTADVVAVEWAMRQQGLVVAPGNPVGITGLADLVTRQARVVFRQAAAGTQLLFEHLLKCDGIDIGTLTTLDQRLRTETEVGLAVLDGQADAGMAIRTIARLLRLEFIPLHWERFDLVVRRRDYFEPPLQKLLGFVRSAQAQAKAADLQGYDLSGHGTVHFNGP